MVFAGCTSESSGSFTQLTKNSVFLSKPDQNEGWGGAERRSVYLAQPNKVSKLTMIEIEFEEINGFEITSTNMFLPTG